MTVWRKSTHSQGGGTTDCVELADQGDSGVGIRDSKAPEDGQLTVPRTELAVLVRRIKSGDLNLPA